MDSKSGMNERLQEAFGNVTKIISDEIEKDFLLNAIDNIPCIKKKADWAIKWINDDESNFAQRLVAFACVEGIFFSGAFCSIFVESPTGNPPSPQGRHCFLFEKD